MKSTSNYTDALNRWIKKHNIEEGSEVMVINPDREIDFGWQNCITKRMKEDINKTCFVWKLDIRSAGGVFLQHSGAVYPFYMLVPVNQKKVLYEIY